MFQLVFAVTRFIHTNHMYRSKLPYFFLALATVLALTAFTLLIIRSGILSRPKIQAPSRVLPNATATAPAPVAPPALPAISTVAEPIPPEDPEEILKTLGLGVAEADPSQLIANIAKVLEDGDFDALSRLTGKDVCDAKTLEHLKALATAHPFKISRPNGVREVGELELNTLARWSLALDGNAVGRDRIVLDLRNNNGKWSVDKLVLPPAPDEPTSRVFLTDSLGVADTFLQAVLEQDFEFARDFVDSQTISDAKIAVLCILFEEGQYELRQSKSLRAMFQRGDTVGYLANVQTPDASQTAQFSLTLRQPPAPANWIISEINLDQLLADYARRVAGGDIYYSPLVKNPQGGDTLALYFEFDEDQINPRTRRQLEIVALILRSDPGKKITLSGHTDALGTEPYNNQLSARRANTVRDFLAAAGVSPAQIVTLAKGASQPRRPNVTAFGKDDPDGRRANRRTEIYLDF